MNFVTKPAKKDAASTHARTLIARLIRRVDMSL
jgi:hypothetical protein